MNKAIGAIHATNNSEDDDNDSENESAKSESNWKNLGWSTFQQPGKLDLSQVVHKQSMNGNSELEESL